MCQVGAECPQDPSQPRDKRFSQTMPRRTQRDLSSEIYSASIRNNYPHIARLTRNFYQIKQTKFLDDVEPLAHMMEDTIKKVVANGPRSGQTLDYFAMLRAAIEVLEEKHFGGPTT